ncbi:hypothetical protein PTSG_10588 [Salpingoeca rosetta]|uniref:Uncharacterized protein n=1 Tax=Salpingoeca rosetta (strain ATCC 50818 / BSB-021) TaxID=946362 RepID=F2URT0_SALR5|nr:uncharacterized protein PTSG_10588 [Salpingoeca rosetta]EGD80335.1 hypothetical protein PTSG_10588 [Salpingoeca rosetta]|eukprot:XP_004988125.1 hypothetical protein PTSG_10588 [Salpingoeca rosetta]
MLKFRLSWKPGKTEYLDGDIYLPVWGPITTTEARLMVTGHDRRIYDNQQYEEQMFYFNTTARVSRYDHGVRTEGIDYCYDCKAEIEILREYLIKVCGASPDDSASLDARIGAMTHEISRGIGGRTLRDANADPGQRKQSIMQKQWIDGRPAYMERPKHEPQYSGCVVGQGIRAPIAPEAQQGTRGLGFTARGFSFASDEKKKSGTSQPFVFKAGPPLLPNPTGSSSSSASAGGRGTNKDTGQRVTLSTSSKVGDLGRADAQSSSSSAKCGDAKEGAATATDTGDADGDGGQHSGQPEMEGDGSSAPAPASKDAGAACDNEPAEKAREAAMPQATASPHDSGAPSKDSDTV